MRAHAGTINRCGRVKITDQTMAENRPTDKVQDGNTKTEEALSEEFRRFLEESRYTPLLLHLESIPQERNSTTLSFKELEGILGISLPSTAKRTRSWWANSICNDRAIFWMMAGWKVSSLGTAAGTVTLVRDNSVLAKATASRGDWSKLRKFFKGLPPEQQQIALTFEELGKLRGMDLPATAFRDRPWWANTKSPQGQAWISAGWAVETAYLASKIAVFRRKGSNYLREIRQYVKRIIECPHTQGQPSIESLTNWVSVCRKVGWYFEASVLYERGGIRIDLLSEHERAELDEDYGISKQKLDMYKNRKQSDDHYKLTEREQEYG